MSSGCRRAQYASCATSFAPVRCRDGGTKPFPVAVELGLTVDHHPQVTSSSTRERPARASRSLHQLPKLISSGSVNFGSVAMSSSRVWALRLLAEVGEMADDADGGGMVVS